MRLILFFLCFSLSIFCFGQPITEDDLQRDESIHKPIVDLDLDLFSPEKGFRGCDWRGKDSDDLDPNTYPGCYDASHGLVDNNCNGIYGWPSDGFESYEDMFAKNTGSRGIVMFGDSAAAAFHIPKKLILEAGLTPEYLKLLFPIGLNEFDWPQKSWSTGFLDEIQGESIYLKLRERNRANHRDYQNLAVNGARARHLVEQVGNLARKPTDKPVLAFIAYIGNDVCKKTLDQMTKPEEFRQQILDGLALLDKKVPSGSKVLMIGLVDGRILWDTMSTRMHPLGITYAELYEFLQSMQGNPCRTWLNPDPETRDKASERARELSLVLKNIAETQKYTNFELAYMDFPLKTIFDMWISQGGDPADLIEAVDGFHPSHIAHRLMAKVVWNELLIKHPSFLGPVNPHNAEIIKKFGDQGGH